MSHNKELKKSMVKASLVTAFALALSMILSNPFTATLSGAFSSQERGDFKVTDLYAQVADGRPVRQLEDRIMIVDIGHANRYEIAEALELLSLCGAKAIGLDVNFAHPGDDDSVLLNAISTTPGLVLPLGITQNDNDLFTISDKPFFYDSLKNINYGVINLPSDKENSSIREFAKKYQLESGRQLLSFVMEIAKTGEDVAVAEALKRQNPLEIIDYPSRSFNIVDLEDIAENAESFADKYVIVGALNEATDMHSTPLRLYMSGAEIHAYALSTLLDQRWLVDMPSWVDYALAIVLCFIVVFFALHVTDKIKGLALRFMQLLFIFATVWIGYCLFVDHGFICNFSHTFIMLAFGFLAIDIVNGVEGIAAYFKSKFKSKKSSYICD